MATKDENNRDVEENPADLRLPGHGRQRLPREAIAAAIERILTEDREINKQTVLLAKLAEQGFHLSAASLSRLLRQMKIKKGDEGFLRLNPARERAAKIEQMGDLLARHGTRIVKPAGLLAIETAPGFARAAGMLARQAYPDDIAGIVADDDMVLLLLSSAEAAAELRVALEQALRGSGP